MRVVFLIMLLMFTATCAATERMDSRLRPTAPAATVATKSAGDRMMHNPPAPAGGECVMNKTANVSINFNSIENDISNIESSYGSKRQEILNLSRQAGVDKLLLSSMSYSVSPQTGMQYNVSGSFGFSVLPAEKAAPFLALLSKKGYNASMSMSAYPNGGNCDFSTLR